MLVPEPLQQIERTYVRFRGRKLSYFSGCDYFRLASHPRVLAALQVGVSRYGLNVAASRMTTGNHRLYGDLEARLTKFFGAESALTVPIGYLGNLVAAQALAGSFSHALLDEQAHASLMDAASILECPILRFKHRDPKAVASAVERCGPGAKLILLTDGLFARNGSVAPLEKYRSVLPKDAMMLVDDAHAAGLLGRSGKGSLEYAGIGRAGVIQTITLSKAFGVYGGAILASRAIRSRAMEHSRLFVGSTPLPLPLAYAAQESVKLLQSDRSLKRRLAANADYVHQNLRALPGFAPEGAGPILFVHPKGRGTTRALKERLLRSGIYPSHIRYPGGPVQGFFRFVISSEHSRPQLDRLVAALSGFFG